MLKKFGEFVFELAALTLAFTELPIGQFVVARGRLELPHPKAVDFESTVSTIPPPGQYMCRRIYNLNEMEYQ